jgi:uncharacterized protein (DUF2267 family)
MQLNDRYKRNVPVFGRNWRFDEKENRKGNKPRSMNFEEYASEGNRIINTVARDLQTNRNRAARITRAVLHAIRDRLPPDDAIQFAQGLPMALKGVFIDRYDISKTPIVIRNREAFIEFVRSKAGTSAPVDFPTSQSVMNALQSVFFVLERNMSYGQVRQIKKSLNIELVNLINGY